MRRFVLPLVIVAVLLLAAAALWFGPLLALAPAQAGASRAVGKPVRIAALSIAPVWPPTVVAIGVQVEGVGTIAQVTAQLDPSSLLGGRARVAVVRLVRPDISVLTDASGLVAPRVTPPPHAAGGGIGGGSANGREAPPDVVVQDARIVWQDPRLALPVTAHGDGEVAGGVTNLVLSVDRLRSVGGWALSDLKVSMTAPTGGAPRLEVKGLFQSRPFTATLVIPAPAGLAPQRPTPVQFDASVAGATVALRGTVGSLANPSHFDGSIDVNAPDVTNLVALLPRSGLSGIPLSGPARLHGDVAIAPQSIRFNSVVFDTPAAAFTAAGAYSWSGQASLNARIEASRLDFDALRPGPSPAGSPVASEPSSPVPAVNADPVESGRVIPARPLPWPRLGGGEHADIDLHVADLIWRGVSYRDVRTHVLVRDHRLSATPITLVLPDGAPANGSLLVDGWSDPPTIHVTARAPSIQVATLLQALRQPPLAGGTGTLNVDLRGTGSDTRTLAASLEGTASLHVAGGEIQNSVFDRLLAETGLPLPKLRGATALRCLDADAHALAGNVDFGSFVIDSDRVRIEGDGGINLADESINVSLHPVWRGVLRFSVPMDIGGTLARPQMNVGGMLAGLMPPPSTACPDAPAQTSVQAPGAPPKLSLKDLLRQLR